MPERCPQLFPMVKGGLFLGRKKRDERKQEREGRERGWEEGRLKDPVFPLSPCPFTICIHFSPPSYAGFDSQSREIVQLHLMKTSHPRSGDVSPCPSIPYPSQTASLCSSWVLTVRSKWYTDVNDK